MQAVGHTVTVQSRQINSVMAAWPLASATRMMHCNVMRRRRSFSSLAGE